MTEETIRALPREGSVSIQIERCRLGEKGARQNDEVAIEEPLEIRVSGHNVAVTMRTPGHDRELAAGFLLGEGIIQNAGDITNIAEGSALGFPNAENSIYVFLAPSVEVDFKRLTRHVFASSSCGVCGKASIDAVRQNFPPVESNATIAMEKLVQLPGALREAQATFSKTGGLHAAAIFDRNGKLIVLREDVGRHNAVDKVVGHGLLNNVFPFDEHVLLVSGRASFEIMQKALAARVPIVCAVSAPSSLAVEFARDNGQTLVGFLRGETMNIYAHPQRVTGGL